MFPGKSIRLIVKKILHQFGLYQPNTKRPVFTCPVCEKGGIMFKPLSFYYFREWDKHQFVHSIFQFETLNLEYYTCPNCKASDRDRLYAIYINKVLCNGVGQSLKVLDIAPSSALSAFLKRKTQLEVRTADLFMQGVDDVVDIMDMHIYSDESWDIFICSHVLEHLEYDVKAMRELHRILARDGWGIAMVPINLGLQNNYEDPTVTDAPGRWKHFAQNDHVRLYSKNGFIERLQSVGFKVNQYDQTFFGKDVFRKYGIHPRSVLYIVTK